MFRLLGTRAGLFALEAVRTCAAGGVGRARVRRVRLRGRSAFRSAKAAAKPRVRDSNIVVTSLPQTFAGPDATVCCSFLLRTGWLFFHTSARRRSCVGVQRVTGERVRPRKLVRPCPRPRRLHLQSGNGEMIKGMLRKCV